MSLRNHDGIDILDVSLKHILKNWIGRSQPPANGRARLLNEAMRTPRRASHPKVSKFSGLVSMTLNENFLQLYLESFKKSPYYSLQPGSMNLNYLNGIIAN
jgi:hypothetical protein